MTTSPAPILTDLDVERLASLLLTRVGFAYRSEARVLRERMRQAIVVSSRAAPSDLVTMNSTVFFEAASGAAKEATLVYPWRARERGAVTIFSPTGTALLGCRVGATAAAGEDAARAEALRILGLRYQPEAAGDWHL